MATAAAAAAGGGGSSTRGETFILWTCCGKVPWCALHWKQPCFLGAEFVNEPRAAVDFVSSASAVIMKVIQTKLPLLMALSSAKLPLCWAAFKVKDRSTRHMGGLENKYKIQSIAPCLHNAFSDFIKRGRIHNTE